MDGVAAAAGVTAIIDISATIASRCLAYSVAVKNAKKDIDRLVRTVTDIKTVLEEVNHLFETHGKTRLSTTDNFSDTLKECLQQLHGLSTRLKPRKTHRAMHRLGLRALSWPFTSEQVEEKVRSLQNYQQTFSLAIQIDQTTLILGVDQKLNRVDKNTDRLLSKLNLPNLPFAAGASFDSHQEEHNSRCLPDTRVDLLRRIEEWAKDRNGKPIFWLNGMAGTGKSTIARTIAQSFANTGQLGGSFFFKKGEGDRGSAARFFTTLTRHLAVRIPKMEPGIRDAVDTDPTISEKALPVQFEKLILQPLSQACQRLSRDMTLIIVVDALDECDNDPDIRMLLRLLSQTQGPQPVTFRLLVTSRPELPIRLEFKKMPDGTYLDLILHEVASHIIKHDIDVYFQHQLRTIREQRSLPAHWPINDQVQALVDMADRLFIFAATACRYIGDERDNPKRRLDDILKYEAGPDVTKLDRIYLPILKKLFLDDQSDEGGRQRRASEFRHIVGTIVTLESPLSLPSLAHLLDIPEEDVRCRLDLLHSVLSIPIQRNMPIRPLHLSFRDFLLDPGRGKDSPFYVDETQVHRQLAESCIKLMSGSLKQDICSTNASGVLVADVESSRFEQYLSPELQYACLYWVHHLQKGGMVLGDNGPVYRFLTKHLLHWLEALSWMRRISDGINAITSLQSVVKNRDCPRLSAFVHDMRRFALYNRSAIEQAPLQAYCGALVFAPTNSIVKAQFRNCVPQWMRRSPEVDADWNALLQTLEGHTDRVKAVAFSPDGAVLASASYDGTVRLWDAVTGAARTTLKGHTSFVKAVAFSPDGAVLASGSYDGIVRLWDAATGTVSITLEGHTHSVNSVAFSPDSAVLASASSDCTVRLWDAATGAARTTLEGHTSWAHAVAFSPNGAVLASADDTVRLWDAATGAARTTLGGHTFSINAVVFSPDGAVLASASKDCSVILWDAATGAARTTLNTDTNVEELSFSNDGMFLLTDRGKLPVATPPLDVVPFQEHLPEHVLVQEQWVIWRKERMLWLPPEHRPRCVATFGNLVALGYESGRLSIVEFDFFHITSPPTRPPSFPCTSSYT